MNSIREILRLSFGHGLSDRQIAASLGLSRSAIWDCLRKARAQGLAWPLAEDMDEAKLLGLLYEPLNRSEMRPAINCGYLFAELKRKGVSLRLLWEEYRHENPAGYQYSQFCEIYNAWKSKTTLVMRQEHKAGHKAFSDFSGGSLKITDPSTGEIKQARLFVSTLGASNYTYAELFESESSASWCTGQAHAFRFFGGTPEIVVPDNPRAVVSKPCRYEPSISADFLNLAQHFDVAVVPARVRRPKDKAKVEAAVGLATRWILARLRNHTFFSLAEANIEVKRLLGDLNDRSFFKVAGSRRSLFVSIEKPQLKPLPVNEYEYTHIQKCRVRNDYHVEIGNAFFSVPHQLAGQTVDARVTSTSIELLFKGTRIASHPRIAESKTSTLNAHMPAAHKEYQGYTPQRFRAWATKVGPATDKFVEGVIARKRSPELGFRASFGLMRLARIYGPNRLENSCNRAIELNSFSFKTVQLLLQNRTECIGSPTEEQFKSKSHPNIRGAAYFEKHKRESNASTSNARSFTEAEFAGNGSGSGDPVAKS